MAQPSVVQSLIGGHGGIARGIGLLARFLITWPTSTIRKRLYCTGDLDAVPLRDFDDRVASLPSRPLPIEDEGSLTLKPPLLELDPDAFAIWRDDRDHVEKTLAHDGDYGELTGLGAKLAEQAASFACVLHVFEQGPVGSISADTMQAGADIALWHLQGARRDLV